MGTAHTRGSRTGTGVSAALTSSSYRRATHRPEPQSGSGLSVFIGVLRRRAPAQGADHVEGDLSGIAARLGGIVGFGYAPGHFGE